MATTKIIITPTPELREALELHSIEEDRDMAWIVREALAKYLNGLRYEITQVHPPKRGGYRKNAGRKPAND